MPTDFGAVAEETRELIILPKLIPIDVTAET